MAHNYVSAVAMVSIHAFRGEGDQASARRFQAHPNVSIHAFRGEGDRNGAARWVSVRSFNPRLPGGRRLMIFRTLTSPLRFQSTPSGGKATL